MGGRNDDVGEEEKGIRRGDEWVRGEGRKLESDGSRSNRGDEVEAKGFGGGCFRTRTRHRSL